MDAKNRNIIIECKNKDCDLFGIKLVNKVPIDTVYYLGTCIFCGSDIHINIFELDNARDKNGRPRQIQTA